MANLTISMDYRAFRLDATRKQQRALLKAASYAAVARTKYMLGVATSGYTDERNLSIVECIELGVPVAVIADATRLSPAKVIDAQRDVRKLVAA